MAHLDTETLSAYIDSELPPADMEQVGRHLASCAACRGEAEELLGVATLVRELPIYRARRRVEIDLDERDRDAGPLPMILEFAKPVALAAVIILAALAGLRLVTDGTNEPERERAAMSELQTPTVGTDDAVRTSEQPGAPEGAAPGMAQAQPDSDEAVDTILQDVEETAMSTVPSAGQPAVIEPPADDENGGLGVAEALTAAVVAIVAGAAGWRVFIRGSSRQSRA